MNGETKEGIIIKLRDLRVEILSKADWRPEANPTGCSAIVADLRQQKRDMLSRYPTRATITAKT